jgi:hypothetical protein
MVDTDTPSMCDTGSIAQIFVTNPSPTSFYEWSTINGNIVGPTTGTTIYVDTPGIYIVKQYLQVGCSVYASDTIEVTRLVNCDVLQTSFANFSAVLNGLSAQLDWRVLNNSAIRNFGVERSNDGIHFTTIGTVDALPHLGTQADYAYLDQDLDPGWRFVYYRIRINEGSGAFEYSNIIKLSLKTRGLNGIGLFPNPASNLLHLEVNAETDGVLLLVLHDFAGKKVKEFMAPVRKGYNLVNLGDITGIAEGVYNARALVGAEVYNKRIVIVH